MINRCYGGFQLSREACNLYLNAVGYVFNKHYVTREIKRHDAIMVQIVKELGKRANTKYSEIDFSVIHPKYENFYDVEEYDGMENIVVHYEAYKLHQIQQIIKNNINDADSISKIQVVLDEENE